MGLALCISGTRGKGNLCMYPSVRYPTTKERDGNLLPHGDVAQRNSRGLPRTGTNDGDGGASDDDDA